MRNAGKCLVALAAWAGMALGAASPAQAQDVSQSIAAESVIESIKRQGVIRIGLSTFTPWSMRALDGELIGFEPDVGRKLAADMGVDVGFVPTAWDGIIPALLAGKFDVIISGMSITPQRNLTVNFTDPYAWSGLAMVANRQLTEGFGLADFDNPEVTFSARRGAVPATVIAEQFPDAELLLFDDEGAVVQEVLNGNAHATMAAEPLPSRRPAVTRKPCIFPSIPCSIPWARLCPAQGRPGRAQFLQQLDRPPLAHRLAAGTPRLLVYYRGLGEARSVKPTISEAY